MQEKLITWFAERLPPLKAQKRPLVAVPVAVIFGGFGLAIYLRSWLDAGVAALATLLLFLAGSAFHIGVLAVLAALGQYAYTRVEASNRRLNRRPGADAPLAPAPAAS
jgi:hypothetical protein